MTIHNFIANQFQHMLWADAKVWQAALESEDVQVDEKLRHLFYHIHIVQNAFLKIWTGGKYKFPKETDFENLKDIRSWSVKYNSKIIDFISTLDENKLSEAVNIPWAKHAEKVLGKKPAGITLIDTMIQVTSHSSYHRGQINARLRELGIEPPLTDFIAWVWLKKPEIKN